MSTLRAKRASLAADFRLIGRKVAERARVAAAKHKHSEKWVVRDAETGRFAGSIERGRLDATFRIDNKVVLFETSRVTIPAERLTNEVKSVRDIVGHYRFEKRRDAQGDVHRNDVTVVVQTGNSRWQSYPSGAYPAIGTHEPAAALTAEDEATFGAFGSPAFSLDAVADDFLKFHG